MKLNRTEQLPRSKTPVASPRRISSPSMTLPTGVKNLSELTPLQIFQKEFHQLESMITRLRQLHIPNGVDRIFTNFASLKSRYSKFCSNCSVLAKRIALRNTQVEIGPEIKENCRQFTLDFGELLLSFENIDNSMESLYTDHLFMLVKSMATNINKYGAICYSDHRTRSIYQQYESFLKQNLDQAQIDLHDFLQDANFDEITPDKSSHIIERYKQISRKMEIEIPHVMNLQRLVVPNGDSLIKLFHADFVEFIPLLNGIHNFVHEITEIFEKIPSFSTALHNLIESVGLPTSQQQTTPLPSPRATSRSISSMQEFPPHPQDPYNIFIPQICFHLGLEEPSESTNHEDTLQDILNTVKQLQDNHNLEVHKLNTRIEALQDINPTSSLSERNKENREFKEELQKKFNLETERIYRDTLNQIQSLSPVNISSKSDSTKTKIDCIITSVQETLDNQKKTISKLNNEISESKDVLSSYREKLIGKDTNSNEHLPNIIENTIQAMENTRRALDQELKNINPTNNTLDEFLHLTLTEYCNYKPQELKNLTNDRMRDMVGRFILDQKEEIKRLKQSLEESNELNKNTNKETINALNQFKTKLEEQLSNTSKTQNTFTDLKKRISELLELHDTKENERFAFRQFLCSFLSQMLHSLKIPQIRFRDASEQQLKAVMSSILEAPEIQQNLVVSSPQSSAQGSRSPSRRNSIIVSQKSRAKREELTLTPQAPNFAQTMTPRRLSNASGISAAPSNLSARSSIRRRMSNDEEQKSEIKQKIADICSIVEGSPAASYSYVPMDMLMKQLKHSITNKMESLKSLRNFAADTCVLINSPEKVSKEEILKKSNDEIFEFIFKGIELIKATKTDLQKETIKEICRNVGPDDVDFMSIPDMVNLTKTQMNLIKTTSNCTQNITKILKEIDTEITSNKSFSPSNELYSRYIKKIELMMKEFSQIPADSILPCVLPYLTESMSLINNITKSLTAASFAPTYQPNHEIIRKMVDDQQELSLKCEKLEKELEEMKNEANVAKNKLTDVMNAANLAANHKIEMIKKANANEIAQALSDYREVESLSDE